MNDRETNELKEQHDEWLHHPHTARILALLGKLQTERTLNLVRTINDKAASTSYSQTLGGRVAGIGDAINLIRNGGAE